MPIYAYGLYSYKRELTEQEEELVKRVQNTQYVPLINTRAALTAMVEEMAARVIMEGTYTLSFCLVQIVQPPGRNGSVPRLQWEVVKELKSMDDDESLEARWMGLLTVNEAEKLITEVTGAPPIAPILIYKGGDGVLVDKLPPPKRVTKNHMVQLFPELKSTPLDIASDYVRDRL